MEEITKITIERLTENEAEIKKQKYIKIKNVEYSIGEPWRKAYINTTGGREEVNRELEEKYQNAIFAIWGDTPTINENDL